MKDFQSVLSLPFRFLFPDSPASAWFLTPEDRAKALQRLKVSLLEA